MSDSSATALSELPPAEATGETHDIYEAIVAALGVRLINLVYRHLATVPGALEWAWGTVGETFAAGVFAREAEALVALAQSGAPAAETISLSATGLAEADGAAVIATLEAYNTANPMNAISLQVIGLALAAARPADRVIAEAPDGIRLTPLLPIAPLDGLSPAVLDRLYLLAAQSTGRQSEIVPSLFRHFTNWPDLLAALSDWLGPVADSGVVDDLSGRIFDAAGTTAQRIFDELPEPGPRASAPPRETIDALRKTVRIFPPAICRMIVIGALLRQAIRP